MLKSLIHIVQEMEMWQGIMLYNASIPFLSIKKNERKYAFWCFLTAASAALEVGGAGILWVQKLVISSVEKC